MTVMSSSTTQYDSYSRPTYVLAKGPGGATYSVAQTSYDTAGRPTCSTLRMNPSTYGSLPGSACTLATQGNFGPDRITKYTYDQINRVTKVTEGFGTPDAADASTLTFTANGRIATALDAENNLTTYFYDGYDRNWKIQFPFTNQGENWSTPLDYEQYSFDANGNVLTFRTRRGETLTMNYDNLNRPTSKIVPSRSGLSSTYTRSVYFAYDLFGNLTDARFDNLTGEGITASYDGRGRLTSETQFMDGATRTVGSAYDVAGNRTSLTYPDSQVFSYIFDGMGRPDLVRDPASNTLVDFNFDAAGRLDRIDRYGTSNNQYFGYDVASRMAGLSIGPSSTSPVNAATFGFNPASQISSATRSNDSFAWNAHQTASRNYWTNGRNQYSAAGPASFTYDENGNLTSDGTSSFVYDVENRLVSRSGGGSSVSLRYDPLGRLYEVNGSQSGIARFVHDGDALVAEYDGSGAMTQRYIHGPAAGADDPLVSYAGSSALIGNARMLYADERGSIVYSTDSSGGGAAINSYDAFGIPGIGNAGRFQYTGQIWIVDLGAYHYKARIYSPTLGRFLQTDPIGYADGMNMYRYVGNDPVNGLDPSGLASDDDILVTAWKTILREGVAPENFRDFKAIPYDDHNVIGEDIVVNARKPRKRKSSRFVPAAAPQSGQCAAPSSGRSDIPRGAGAKSFSEAESIARRIANEELARTRRITDNYRLGGHNDIYDAERHARWVYRMSVAIGSGWAGLFATGHEGEGMRDGQPFIEMQMDLSNNSLGMNAAINGAGIPTRSTPGLTYIRNGKLVRKGC